MVPVLTLFVKIRIGLLRQLPTRDHRFGIRSWPVHRPGSSGRPDSWRLHSPRGRTRGCRRPCSSGCRPEGRARRRAHGSRRPRRRPASGYSPVSAVVRSLSAARRRYSESRHETPALIRRSSGMAPLPSASSNDGSNTFRTDTSRFERAVRDHHADVGVEGVRPAIDGAVHDVELCATGNRSGGRNATNELQRRADRHDTPNRLHQRCAGLIRHETLDRAMVGPMSTMRVRLVR